MSLVSVASTTPSAALRGLIEDTMGFAAASRAASTVQQYQSNWKSFAAFCTEHGLTTLPATIETVAIYLTHLATSGKSVGTIIGHLSAVKYFHSEHRLTVNWSDPLLTKVLSGIQRSTTRTVVKAEAILTEDLQALVSAVGQGVAGLRDRAIFLVGFAGAFRRSEITAITVENIEFVDEGMVIHLDRSKTDQLARGADIAIPHARDPLLCPVRATLAWLEASSVTQGPAFRRVTREGRVGSEALSEEAIRLILAKAVERAGLGGKLSPHSLRAGFCTQAAISGAGLSQIARQARHTNPKTTMGYIRVSERFKDHAGAGLL
jgi:site-specific recombinase XerD